MNQNNYVISYLTMRQLIGILGILLPFMCWGINVFVNETGLLTDSRFIDAENTQTYIPDINLKSSISHFYYTAAGPLFTGILITLSIFLFCYTGYPRKEGDRLGWLTDKRITTFAAICALGIVIFPTDSDAKISDNIHIFESSRLVGGIHLASAGIFFFSMAVMCIVNFRRRPDLTEPLNDAEGKIYWVCGWGIILCLLTLLIGFILKSKGIDPGFHFVFITEAIMLVLFGTAWLVKGKSSPTLYMLKMMGKEEKAA